jgi:hypothetical protein
MKYNKKTLVLSRVSSFFHLGSLTGLEPATSRATVFSPLLDAFEEFHEAFPLRQSSEISSWQLFGNFGRGELFPRVRILAE